MANSYIFITLIKNLQKKMKKYLLIVAIATFTLSIVACGGKKGDAPAKEESVQEEVTTTTTTTDTNDVLAKYETIILKAIELQEKISKGNTAAIQEYTTLTEEMMSIATELQNALANMTPEQTQKFAELGQKWVDAATKAAQP